MVRVEVVLLSEGLRDEGGVVITGISMDEENVHAKRKRKP